MSKFEIGDKVKVIAKNLGHKFDIGDIVVIKNITGIELKCENEKTHWYLSIDEVELYERKVDVLSEYNQSNRYKLHQAIKATGFHAEKLSLASNHAKTYFTGFTAESRFNSRGDITEDRLSALLTTLAFAERELLGISSDIYLDDVAPKPDESGKEFVNNFIDVEAKKDVSENFYKKVDGGIKLMASSEYKKITEDFKSGMQDSHVEISETHNEMKNQYYDEPKNQSDLYSKYFDSANKRIQEKKDAKVKNFLIVLLVFVVLLASWFFFK